MTRKYVRVKKTAREIAKEAGLPHYQGKPCPHGHSGKRYVANGGCLECNSYDSGKMKAWRERNKDKYNAHCRKAQAKWRDANRDYYNRRAREWRAKQKALNNAPTTN